jgi:hypothetical protein
MSAKSARERSRGYPAYRLNEAIAILQKVKASFALGPFRVQDIGTALGSRSVSGAVARKAACLRHFGLIVGRNDGIRVSDLGKKLLRPLPDEDKHLLREAFLSCDLYKEVYNRFAKDGEFPRALDVILERDFAISHGHGFAVAAVLRASAEDAQIFEHRFVDAGEYEQDADTTHAPLVNVESSYTNEIVTSNDDEQAQVEFAGPVGNGARIRTSAGELREAERLLVLELPQLNLKVHYPAKLQDLDRATRWINTVVLPTLTFAAEKDGFSGAE